MSRGEDGHARWRSRGEDGHARWRSRGTHFKLGLFALAALFAAVTAAFGLGAWTMRGETVRYHTYFDESVQGLEIGSSVKYRGVPIGNVGVIEIAPDRRHVDVTFGIELAAASRLGLATAAPDLRAQLGTQGITGVKFVDIDFFDPKTTPPPPLPFQPAANYIPAAPSLFKGLEDDLKVVLSRLPALVEVTTAALRRLDAVLADLHEAQIPDRVAKVVDETNAALADVRRFVRHVEGAKLPDRTAAALEELRVGIEQATALLAQIGGDGGLVASTRRATDSLGDLGRRTSASTGDLERTLRDLDEAARAIRDLAQSIERDPDMLVKGRAREDRR